MNDHPLPARPRRRLLPRVAVAVALLGGAGGALHQVWQQARQGQAAEAAAHAAAELERNLRAFLDDDARPLLQRTREQDLAAVGRALEKVDKCFAAYASGIDDFSSSLTGWGMRFKILWRKGVETAERKEEHSWTAQLVRDKFHQHVVSDTRLEGDLNEILKQFAYELESSRNELVMDLDAKLRQSGLPVNVRDAALADFRADFREKSEALLRNLPGQSVTIGVGSLTAGIVAEEAVRQLVRVVLAQAATRLASGAAASGGAAGVAVAAGGTGGTAIAPGVGTAIGIVGGFVVGAVVDWWMTDEFEEKVNGQCRDYLSQTRAALVSGDGGLQKLLTAQVDQSAAAYEKAVESSVMQSPVP